MRTVHILTLSILAVTAWGCDASTNSGDNFTQQFMDGKTEKMNLDAVEQDFTSDKYSLVDVDTTLQQLKDGEIDETNFYDTTGQDFTSDINSQGDAEVTSLRLYKSGTRLKARLLHTKDGAQSFLGWYDAQLGVNCIFSMTSDGKKRCVPYDFPSSNSAVSYYADPDCTEQLLAITLIDECPNFPPKWVSVFTSVNHCEGLGEYAVYEVGASFTEGSVYSIASGKCLACTLPAGFVSFHIKQKADPSLFVEAFESIE